MTYDERLLHGLALLIEDNADGIEMFVGYFKDQTAQPSWMVASADGSWECHAPTFREALAKASERSKDTDA